MIFYIYIIVNFFLFSITLKLKPTCFRLRSRESTFLALLWCSKSCSSNLLIIISEYIGILEVDMQKTRQSQKLDMFLKKFSKDM